jgi:DNA-binding MarR family transcriptional regulator
VWLVSRATIEILNRALAPSGLDAEEFAFYSMLASSSSGTTPSHLAQWMAAPGTTVSSVIRRLEERRHVRRDRNPADGRSYLIVLTREGRHVHRVAAQAFEPVLRQVVQTLGSDEPAVQRTLIRLREVLDQVGQNVSPTGN